VSIPFFKLLDTLILVSTLNRYPNPRDTRQFPLTKEAVTISAFPSSYQGRHCGLNKLSFCTLNAEKLRTGVHLGEIPCVELSDGG
jgi:hypothetical protein